MITCMLITRRFSKEIEDVFNLEGPTNYIFDMDAGSGREMECCLCLAEVMIRALLASNPVLNNSQRLKSVIREMVFKDANEKIAKEILNYLSNHCELYEDPHIRALDVEGFISFMLREYSEQIDTVLYRVVRDGLRKGETI